MANIYVRSTDGANGDNGSTWALAKADLTGAAGIDASGDTIWLSQVHAESSASGQTWAIAGTVSFPTRIICGNDGAEPPTAVATTATVTNTLASGNALTLNGNAYVYGVTFSFLGTMNVSDYVVDNYQSYDTCVFLLAGSGSSCNLIQPASGYKSVTRFRNCQFKFGGTGQYINAGSRILIEGGSIVSGGSTPTAMFRLGVNGRGERIEIEGFDFSNLTGGRLLDATNSVCGKFIVRNCRLASGMTAFIYGSIGATGLRAEMYNCDENATNYKLWIEDFAGTIRDEITDVRTNGASDGATPLAWKMTTNSNARYPAVALVSPEIVIWNDTTGSSKTLTIEILHDSVTNLQNNEVWVEVDALATSAAPLGTLSVDSPTNVLTAAADQTTSSVAWTTSGLTNPNKQKLEVTFTPQLKGPVVARVYLAKPSKTIYVDPLITLA